MFSFMKNTFTLSLLTLVIFCLGCGGNGNNTTGDASKTKDTSDQAFYTEADFASVKKFNTHVHISVFDSVFIKQAEADNFRFLTVNVNSPAVPVEQQQEVAVRLIKAFPGEVYFASAFSVKDFNTP